LGFGGDGGAVGGGDGLNYRESEAVAVCVVGAAAMELLEGLK
jgi:hypothetical protein